MSIVMHDNGVIKLPPGFRFHPTDEELVVQYLRRKVYSCPLPASIIPEVDLAKLNPWDLPGGWEQERYFFALREAKYPNGRRSNRATGCGYWKATGKDKAIAASKIGRVVGTKKTLVFYGGKAPSGERTDWIMHEYSLPALESTSCIFPQRKNSTHASFLHAECRRSYERLGALSHFYEEEGSQDGRRNRRASQGSTGEWVHRFHGPTERRPPPPLALLGFGFELRYRGYG